MGWVMSSILLDLANAVTRSQFLLLNALRQVKEIVRKLSIPELNQRSTSER